MLPLKLIDDHNFFETFFVNVYIFQKLLYAPLQSFFHKHTNVYLELQNQVRYYFAIYQIENIPPKKFYKCMKRINTLNQTLQPIKDTACHYLLAIDIIHCFLDRSTPQYDRKMLTEDNCSLAQPISFFLIISSMQRYIHTTSKLFSRSICP